MVRAKFQVTKVARSQYGNSAYQSQEVTLSPVYDQSIEEDRRFAKATPSGMITLTIDNPPAADYLKLGSYFYIDFTEVPKKEEAAA